MAKPNQTTAAGTKITRFPWWRSEPFKQMTVSMPELVNANFDVRNDLKFESC